MKRDLGYLFVLTYGRSGSTLLAGVLNSIPGYLIRGENHDALHHLYRFHTTLLSESTRAPRPTLRRRTHPFFGIGDFPEQKSLRGIRRLVLDTVLRPKEDTRVTGFKEIRWYHDDLEEYVAWLREVFPGARFLLNTRDLDAVAASAWWAKQEGSREHLAANHDRLLTLAASLGEAAFHVHYDDYVADPSTLRSLFTWLGEPFDEEVVRDVFARRHSV